MLESMKIVYVLGVDTGVGKTVLTGLLLRLGNLKGYKARAVKPIATGSYEDAAFLCRLHDPAVAPEDVCPFMFKAPVAPLLAARLEGSYLTLEKVVRAVNHLAAGHQLVLVEGCGGLLSPVAHDWSFLDLVRELPGKVCLVAENRLGVISQVLCACEVLLHRGLAVVAVVLNNRRQNRTLAEETNRELLRELLPPNLEVIEVGFLGHDCLYSVGQFTLNQFGQALPDLLKIFSKCGLT